MNALRAHAVAHIQRYPVEMLDGHTLRILRENCEDWLKEHHRIDAEVVSAIADGRTAPVALGWWRDSEREDKEAAEAALATITGELNKRGFH